MLNDTKDIKDKEKKKMELQYQTDIELAKKNQETLKQFKNELDSMMHHKNIDRLFNTNDEQELAKLKHLFKKVNQKQMRTPDNLILDMMKINKFRSTQYDKGYEYIDKNYTKNINENTKKLSIIENNHLNLVEKDPFYNSDKQYFQKINDELGNILDPLDIESEGNTIDEENWGILIEAR